MDMQVKFNGEQYIAKYNEQSGYYELELKAPEQAGGIYSVDAVLVCGFEETETK